ncbi:hypothetical protein LINPERHAP1_LOCUS31072 [Linum perenne]
MMRRVHGNYQRLASLDPEALCPNAWVASYRAAYRHPIKPLNDFSQWEVSIGPNLRPPTIQRPTSGPKQRKRRLEAGELISRKDKRGRPYNTVGKSGQPQKCTICKKTGHNRRAHGNDQVQMDGGSSSTRPPEQPSQEATPAVRNRKGQSSPTSWLILILLLHSHHHPRCVVRIDNPIGWVELVELIASSGLADGFPGFAAAGTVFREEGFPDGGMRF